jgi:alpha-tubulin suppressor-like RCC1 family protein
VDALLGEEVTDVACGRRHVVAVTSDDQQPIFTWGTDSDGCLGRLKGYLHETALF